MDLEQDVDISTSAEAFEATALCRGHVVHTGKDMCETPEVQPLPPALRRTPAEEKSEAQWPMSALSCSSRTSRNDSIRIRKSRWA